MQKNRFQKAYQVFTNPDLKKEQFGIAWNNQMILGWSTLTMCTFITPILL